MKKLLYNATVITMESNKTEQAVLFDEDKIIAVGSDEDLLSLSKDAEKINLNGKTVLPAFIDSHSHFLAVANSSLQVSLERCTSFDEISKKISDFSNQKNLKSGEWIVAKGFDHNNMQHNMFPKATELDKISKDNPIVIQHKSGHSGSFNSLAMKKLGINSSSVSPVGGRIEMRNGFPTGFMEESAYMNNIQKIPMPDLQTLIEAVKKAQDKYASFGICTVQEGMMVPSMKQLYEQLLIENIFKLDVVGYVNINEKNNLMSEFQSYVKKYKNHFKIGGYKMFLDGSPQARTAWMLTPYKDDKSYYGYGTLDDNTVFENIKTSIEKDVQILAHCNGDAAIEQYLNALQKASDLKFNLSKIRPVIIHSQFIQENQLDKSKVLSAIPSFFIAHTFYWGDIHIKNFGLERASKISPAKSAVDKNIIFTFHQDSPVIEPNMLETVWCAVTRKTKSGIELGKDQRISVLEALKAVTINAAFQYFEENEKGSIKKGKKSDFVILDKNPLETKVDEIKSIQVVETIKDGKTIFKN